MAQLFGDWFWSENWWLPPNVTWTDLDNTEERTYAHPRDLLYVLPYSVVLYVLRLVVEKYIARPIGVHLQISDEPNKPPASNQHLEHFYQTVSKNPGKEQISGLSKQVDWNEYKVMKWMKQRKNLTKPSRLVKFTETFWRFILYSCLFTFGNVTLYVTNPRCITEPRSCWAGYPESNQLNFYMYWYYHVELAFYMSLLISQFADVRRKDFREMFIHHVATILLIATSYCINFIQAGAAVMLLHDFSDIFLEFSKMVNYAKLNDVAGTIGWISFSLTFVLARMVYFPFWILNSLWFDCSELLGTFPLYYFFCFWLFALQLLNVNWTGYILIGVANFLRSGGIDDERSESEASSDDEDSTTAPSPSSSTSSPTE